MNRSFYHFVTKHAFGRQTDGRTDRILIARPRLHSMQRGCGKTVVGLANMSVTDYTLYKCKKNSSTRSLRIYPFLYPRWWFHSV